MGVGAGSSLPLLCGCWGLKSGLDACSATRFPPLSHLEGLVLDFSMTVPSVLWFSPGQCLKTFETSQHVNGGAATIPSRWGPGKLQFVASAQGTSTTV